MKKLLKKVLLSIMAIYSIDIVLSNIGYFIPINLFSIIYVTMFGGMGLVSYVILLIYYFW